MQKMIVRAALAATLLGTAASPGLAHGVAHRPLALTVAPALSVAPDVNPGPDAFRPVMGRRDAERAANSVGLADVDDVDLDDSVWTVTGTDLRDRDMTVIVDARSGRILKARYD